MTITGLARSAGFFVALGFSAQGATLTPIFDLGPSDYGGGAGGERAAVGGTYLATQNVEASVGMLNAAGQAYVYDVRTGDGVSNLAPPTPVAGGAFATAVDVENGVVAVGDGLYDDPNTGFQNVGRVHLFSAGTGALIRTIENPDPQVSNTGSSNLFGAFVKIDGDHLLAAPLFSMFPDDRSTVVFDLHTGAVLQDFLVPIGLNGSDLAGGRVAIVKNNPGFDSAVNPWGARHVVVYDAETGTELLEITPDPANTPGSFQTSLAIGEKYLAVTRYSEAPGDEYLVVIDVFNVVTGEYIRSIEDPDARDPFDLGFHEFGFDIAIDGDLMLVGSYGLDLTRNEQNGAVYLFDLASGDLLGSDYGGFRQWLGQSVSLDAQAGVAAAGSNGDVVRVYDLGTSQPVSAVPAPAAFPLLALAMAGLVTLRRAGRARDG